MIAKITKSYIVDVSQKAFDHMLANGVDDALQSLEENGDDSTSLIEKYVGKDVKVNAELDDETCGVVDEDDGEDEAMRE